MIAPADQLSLTRRTWSIAAAHFLAPIAPFLHDPGVTEIMVNGPARVFVERNGNIVATDARFADADAVEAAAHHVAQFVGRRLSNEVPVLDGRLPEGHRVSIVLPPIAGDGAMITIRKFSKSSRTLDDLVALDSITREAADFLVGAIREHSNVLVSGGTGTGKTTVLGGLAAAFRPAERVIVLEDTRELQIPSDHVVHLEARPADRHGRGAVTIRDLFVASLRMRPDRIIVGEVRGSEALDMIQAMTSGHRGSLSTLHANSPLDACHRLETMALLGGVRVSEESLRRQIASAVDLVVQLARGPDGRRRVVQIGRITLDRRTGCYAAHSLFERERGTGPLLRLNEE